MIELGSGEYQQSANLHTKRNINRKKGAWATFVSWDKPLIIFVGASLLLAVGALFVLLTPVIDFIFNFMGLQYAWWSEWNEWIVAGERGLIIGAVLGLAALLFALLARYRVRREFSVYVEAGCPQCQEHELIRVRRNRRDRALAFFGLSVRRYSCRNCTWHGVRLAGYHHEKQNEVIDVLEKDQADEIMLEEPLEIGEETLTIAELEIDTVSEDGSLELIDGFDSEIVEDESTLPEEISEFSEVPAVETDDYEEIAAEIVEEETAETVEESEEIPEAFEEPILDEIPEEMFFEAVDEGDVSEPVHQMENEVLDEGAPTAVEDDEFARLCLEVARSKR